MEVGTIFLIIFGLPLVALFIFAAFSKTPSLGQAVLGAARGELKDLNITESWYAGVRRSMLEQGMSVEEANRHYKEKTGKDWVE